jgi:PAS domain S-box-containing protein
VIETPSQTELAALRQRVAELEKQLNAIQADARHGEEHLRRVLDSLFVFVGIMSPEGILLEANRAPLEAAGITRGEAIGLPVWDTYWFTYSTVAQAQIRDATRRAAAGESVHCDMDVRMKDGELMSITLLISPVRDEHGRITHLVPSAVPLTERKRAEEALRESERRYTALFENRTNGIAHCRVITDQQGNPVDYQYLEINAAFERITGIPKTKIEGKTLREVFKGQDAALLTDYIGAYGNVALNGGDLNLETYFDPTRAWYAVYVYSPKRGEFVAMFTDITERKKAEEALRESEMRFRGAFENAAVGIAHVAPDGRWLRANQRLCQITGYSLEELLELTFSDITHPDDVQADWEMARALLRGEIPHYQLEKRYIRKNGETVWVNLTVALLRDEAGHPLQFVSVIEDISERKQAENALRVSEATLLSFFNSTPFLMGVVEIAAHDILHISDNLAARAYFGGSTHRRWSSDLGIPPESIENWLRHLRRAQETGQPVSFELKAARADGRTLLANVSFIHIARSGRPRFSYVVEDITDRKRAERHLRENEERLRLASLASREAIWDWDAASDRLLWNRNVEILFGWKDAAGTPVDVAWWIERIHPEDRPSVADRFQMLLDDPGREFWEDEYRFLKSNGLYAYVVDRGYVLRGQDGKPYRMTGSMMDLSERRRMENELRENEMRFRALAEAVPGILFSMTARGYTDFLSPSYWAFTGRNREETQDWMEALHPEDGPRIREQAASAIKAGQPFEMEFRMRRHDGVFHWFIARARPSHDDGGRVAKWFGAATDIEAHKQIEQALRLANDDLNRFAFAAAHDLREPLRNVGAFTDLLVTRFADSSDQTVARARAVIREGVQRMDLLLKDLLEYTRATTPESHDTQIDTQAALKKALANLSQAVAESGAGIEAGELPVLPGNESQFVRIFQNLIGNAIKYCGSNQPRVRITAERQEDAWLFAVQDNGVGIDPEFREHVFGMFKRLHGKEIPGTGIGLAICAKIIESRGGRIWVESEPGLGSTFLFTWPHHEPFGKR